MHCDYAPVIWGYLKEPLLHYLPLSQLDQMRLDKIPSLSDVTATDSQKQNIQAILDLLEESGQEKSKPLLTALHLIISAMDGERAVLKLNVAQGLHLKFRKNVLQSVL